MPRDRHAKFIHMLHDFKIINQDEFYRLLFSTIGHKDLAQRDRDIIQKILGAGRCTFDKIKVILIVQQIDRISMLVKIAEDINIRKSVDPNHANALFDFDQNDYEITTKEYKLLTGNKFLDQLYREARANKECFKLMLVRIMQDLAFREALLCLYSLRGTSVISKLMSKLFSFIPVVKVEQQLNLEWQAIRKPLEQDFMETISSYMCAHMESVYLEFWNKIIRNLNDLNNKNNQSQYDDVISKVENYAQIAAGAPTPSPMSSPRARSPRLYQ